MKITIGKKIYIGVSTLVGIFLVVCSLTIWYINDLSDQTIFLVNNRVPQMSEIQEASTQMLEARRSEKDFLMRLDTKYLTRHDKSMAKLKERLTQAAGLSSNQRQEQLKQALTLSEAYQINFKVVAQLIADRGLAEDQGLRGKIREAIHKMESRITELNQDALLVPMLMCRRHEKDYLLRGKSKYVDKLTKRVALCKSTARELGLADDVLQAIDKDLDIYLAAFNDLVLIDTQIADKTKIFRSATHDAQEIITKLAEETYAEVPVLHHEMSSLIANTRYVLMLAMLGGIVCAIVLSVTMTRMITRPIKPLTKRAEEIAQGDLTGEELPITSQDELGHLTTCMNQMSAQLRQILQNVLKTTNQVNNVATEVSANAQNMSANASDQSGITNNVAAAVEEMSATVSEVARQSSSAASTAQDAGNYAREGGHIVQQTVESMQQIASSVNESSQGVEELGKRSEMIGKIIDVIRDIADQTNLLALNAAIEAARAGDAGRGFAVVADEVRKLAERTSTATEEVTESITAIQHETTMAVERMQAGTQTVAQGVELAGKAGKSLEQILQGAEQVANMISSIASASEQQASATRQIAQSVETISSGARQTNESAGSAENAASNLSNLAVELREMISRFKIPEAAKQAA